MVVAVPMVAAQSSGTLSVSGSSVETVRFAVRDATAHLEAHLANSGDTRLSDGVISHADEGGDAGAAICYAISGKVMVSSNTPYDLLVSDASAVPGLGLLTDTPASYVACASGEPVSDSMFAAADPPRSWAPGQTRTRMRVHPFTLGLVVEPGDDPLAVLGATSFAVLARPID